MKERHGFVVYLDEHVFRIYDFALDQRFDEDADESDESVLLVFVLLVLVYVLDAVSDVEH
jgi:hypothetical protein